MYHTYGMTETVSHIALRHLNGRQRSDRFVPFEEVHLGVDARGCLTITSALTRGETLYTNNLVEFHTDGSFRWLGRIDNVIDWGVSRSTLSRWNVSWKPISCTIKGASMPSGASSLARSHTHAWAMPL